MILLLGFIPFFAGWMNLSGMNSGFWFSWVAFIFCEGTAIVIWAMAIHCRVKYGRWS